MMNSAIILVKEKRVLEEQIVDVLATAPDTLQIFGLTAGRVRPYIPKKGSSLKQVGNLTSRELQVLDLLSKGLTYKEVGTKLNIGHETVRTHVKKFCLKLHARNRIEAMAKYRSKSS